MFKAGSSPVTGTLYIKRFCISQEMNINNLDFREHFIGGDNSGSAQGANPIGAAGWNYDSLGVFVPGEENHPGIVRLSTAGQGTGYPYPSFARLVCGNSDAKFVHSSNLTRFRSVLRFSEPNADGDFTDEGIYTGFGVSSNTYPGNPDMGPESIFFSFRASVNPKWQATCQFTDPEFGVQATTITDTGADVALNTWYILEGVNTGGVWEFFVDGVSIGTVSTNVPVASLTPQFRLRTEQVHETGYMIDLDCDEFAYRLATTSPLPGIVGW